MANYIPEETLAKVAARESLCGAYLLRVNLTGANLSGADMNDAQPEETNLSVAILWGIELDDAPRRNDATLEDVMVSAIGVASEFEYGRQEILRVEDEFAVYRTYECAERCGMSNLDNNCALMRRA